MAYTVPTTAVPGTIITAADHNTSVRDNILYLKEHEVPTGSLIMWAGATASPPPGYLICDGSAVSRTGFAALFTAIGTTYGTGNGSTTFNLPDFRGRFPIGAGTGSGLTARTLGSSGGNETHDLTEGELPAHVHTLGNHTHPLKTFAYDPPTTSSPSFGMINQTSGSTGTWTTEAASGDTGSVGSGDSVDIMNPWEAVNFIIKT